MTKVIVRMSSGIAYYLIPYGDTYISQDPNKLDSDQLIENITRYDGEVGDNFVSINTKQVEKIARVDFIDGAAVDYSEGFLSVELNTRNIVSIEKRER